MMARVYCEIELEVTGTRQPGDPSVGVGPTVEDLEVERISIINYNHKTKNYDTSPLLNALDKPCMISGEISAAFVEQLEEDMIEAIYDEDVDDYRDEPDYCGVK